MVVRTLWWGLGTLGFTQDGGYNQPGRILTSPKIRRFRYEDNNVANIAPVQPHYYYFVR